jgi:hypothetical protein
MSHTPGPWSIATNKTAPLCDEYTTVESESADAHVAFVFSDAHADARLIAAAPDLLEACKMMAGIGTVDDGKPTGGTIPWVHNAGITMDIEKLRAICLAFCDVWNNHMLPAIAAAEGRAEK